MEPLEALSKEISPREGLNITELKMKRKQRFDTFQSNRKTRSRLEGILTAKNYDTETI